MYDAENVEPGHRTRLSTARSMMLDVHPVDSRKHPRPVGEWPCAFPPGATSSRSDPARTSLPETSRLMLAGEGLGMGVTAASDVSRPMSHVSRPALIPRPRSPPPTISWGCRSCGGEGVVRRRNLTRTLEPRLPMHRRGGRPRGVGATSGSPLQHDGRVTRSCPFRPSDAPITRLHRDHWM